MLIDGGNDVLASAVNIFELAARTAAARRIGANVTAERVRQLTIAAGFPLLAVSDAHAAAVEGLATFHGDPFDRLLLAQAQVEGLQLVTHDERLAQYDSRTILF
jgi:PIN domain nuclease of toxin-antitoxin system